MEVGGKNTNTDESTTANEDSDNTDNKPDTNEDSNNKDESAKDKSAEDEAISEHPPEYLQPLIDSLIRMSSELDERMAKTPKKDEDIEQGQD